MEDSEVVGSIVAGDPHGLVDAFDRYADPLYKYCRTLLRDPADAADAVQDAFVIAASRLDRLREPDRLRAWLYALARNESLRILRSKRGAPAPYQAPDSGGIGRDAGQPDLRALFEDARDGLNPGEREAIELQLRQDLDPAEIAAVLGLSRGHAHTLLSRAGEQLWTCLAVLLVSRGGRDSCGELDALLAGWDGRLTVPLRKRVHRHIEHCAVCGARRSFELRPAKLRELAPGAALAAGAELSLQLAPGLPEGLRAHTITIAAGQESGATAHRAAVLSRAGAFNHGGFPKPVRSSPRVQTMEAAVVIAAVAIAAATFALTGNTQLFKSAAPKPPTAPGAAITSPTAGQTQPQPATHGTSAAPTPTASSSAKPRQKSTSSTSAPTSTTASPSPAKRSPTRSAGSPTSSPTPTPTPGTLSEDPPGGTAAAPEALVLAPDGAGKQIELSASGSGDWNVGWSVSVANDSGGAVSVSPTDAGTLTPSGAITTLTVTANQFIACGSSADPTITVEPGGAVYSVCTSLL
jgi:RNA polymerase sigma factor (sigma-70 family)